MAQEMANANIFARATFTPIAFAETSESRIAANARPVEDRSRLR